MALPRDVVSAIEKQAPKLLRASLLKAATTEGNKIKASLIAEFLNHPITQEIKAGPNANNTSGTLDGKGNLFSFIGFESGQDPIQPILDRFQEIRTDFLSYTRKGILVNITIPEAEEIFSLTPLPWADGRSWAKGIESGISGLGFFLNKKGIQSSRSGGGIQSDNQVEKGVRFKNTQYISALLKKYQKTLLVNETIISA